MRFYTNKELTVSYIIKYFSINKFFPKLKISLTVLARTL